MFGRLFHIVFDSLLISVALAGIKRNTGLTPSLRRIPNKDARSLVKVWLETGEWVSILSNGNTGTRTRRALTTSPTTPHSANGLYCSLPWQVLLL